MIAAAVDNTATEKPDLEIIESPSKRIELNNASD